MVISATKTNFDGGERFTLDVSERTSDEWSRIENGKLIIET